jgi:hypothetical protein
MKKLSILLFIPFLILGCFFLKSIERKIGDKIDDCQPNADCIIKVTEITRFQWDKMYVFDYAKSDYEIGNQLGTEYDGRELFKRRLIFLKDGKIVYQENLLTAISDSVDRAVGFDKLTYNNSLLFTPETAIFRGQKYSPDGSKISYFLQQVE